MMINTTKLYYLSHPCTSTKKSIIENRIDEDILAVELKIKYLGIHLMRPLQLIPSDWGHKKAMVRCFTMIEACDAVIFADGWEESKGCRMEHDFCVKCGIGIIEV